MSLLGETDFSEKNQLTDCLKIFREKIEDIKEEIQELDKIDLGKIKEMVT
jgi:hypothetical protein